jgi:CopG family transcriptional regulator/antitoxin EndoAI
MISLPNSLLQEVDVIVAVEKKNRSEFIRDAMKLYIKEREKRQIREKMKKGYSEMAKINLAWAELGLSAENEAHYNYEKRLSGCE